MNLTKKAILDFKFFRIEMGTGCRHVGNDATLMVLRNSFFSQVNLAL